MQKFREFSMSYIAIKAVLRSFLQEISTSSNRNRIQHLVAYYRILAKQMK